jgi:Spy/CpxP family protein refolding chaperone
MNLASRFTVLFALALMSVSLASTIAVAQPLGGGGGGGRGGFRGGPGGPGGFFGGGGTLGLIQQQEVQREVELTEDQEAELQALGESIRDQMRDEMRPMFEGMRDLSDEERQTRFEEARARMEEIGKEAETKMQSVLLPHQFERLKQIDLQSRLQRGGAAALTQGELADTLGLSESQREQLQEKTEEVQKDLEAKISQLRIDARNQVLEVLTTEQRAKLQAMMGSDFALPEPQFGPPGGRRGGFGAGGRGGRGGRGGQGGNGGGNGGNGGDGGAGGGTE